MQWVENAVLIIVGGGNAFDNLKKIVSELGHADRILMKGWLPFEELGHYTENADIGLAIEKDSNLNYKYSLSNKIFDYIHAELPILSSRLIENERIFAEWEIGVFIDNHEPKHIAQQLTFMLADGEQQDRWTENLKKAKKAYSWEGQVPILLSLYGQVSKD